MEKSSSSSSSEKSNNEPSSKKMRMDKLSEEEESSTMAQNTAGAQQKDKVVTQRPKQAGRAAGKNIDSTQGAPSTSRTLCKKYENAGKKGREIYIVTRNSIYYKPEKPGPENKNWPLQEARWAQQQPRSGSSSSTSAESDSTSDE